MHHLTRTCAGAAAAVVAMAGLAGVASPASAQGRHHHASAARTADDDHHARREARQVRLRDDCDPATFDAALGPGACTGDGETTFDELVASLVAHQPSAKWRIQPQEVEVEQGERLRLVNTGGEFHSFTEVASFGPGCVPQVNDLLGLNGPPVADCAAAFADPMTALPGGARGEVDTSHLAPGTHRFECVVHPWMTATVRVEAD